MRRIWPSNRFGFYFITLSFAFGLGNLWRFPYIVAENGGGAFVLLYLFLVLILGLPLLSSEILLGKISQKNMWLALDGLKNFPSTPYSRFLSKYGRNFSKLGVVTGLLVLSYFSVVSSWVLFYGANYALLTLNSNFSFNADMMNTLKTNPWLQVGLTVFHLILVMAIVSRRSGRERLERWLSYLMPVFILILCGLAIRSLSLDTSTDALRFFLYPNFSKIGLSSLSYAVGHVLFTLSLGFGAIISFGRRLKSDAYIPSNSFRIVVMDSLLSLFAGLLIFPLVILGTTIFSGPELLFQSVPVFLSKIPKGDLFGLGFFTCLYFAALGSSVSLFETSINNFIDYDLVKKSRASLIIGSICILFSIIPALSHSLFRDWGYGEKGLIEVIDIFLINWALPIVALVLSQVIYYGLEQKIKTNEFLHKDHLLSHRLITHWSFSMKWVIPAVIILSLVLETLSYFE